MIADDRTEVYIDSLSGGNTEILEQIEMPDSFN